MGLASAGGGDDRLQVGIAVFAIVISLMTALMVPMIATEESDSTGYSAEDVASSRIALETFTGESMISAAPWKLTAVYTPWTPGQESPVVSDAGWVYGSRMTTLTVDGTEQVGKTTGIRLDPSQKSESILSVSDDTYTYAASQEWYVDPDGGGVKKALGAVYKAVVTAWTKLDGGDSSSVGINYATASAYNFTGYLYSFDPMLKIATHTESGGGSTEKVAMDDAELSLVWYSYDGNEGISTGLVLYSNRSESIISNISLGDIVTNYASGSAYATSFKLDFDGTIVNLAIKFDSDVVSSSQDLYSAFSEGKWTMALYAQSASAFLDLSNSTSFTTSVGNMLQTYIDIFTFSLPSVDLWWSIILWILCIMPVELTMLMFLSRFGLAGIGAGILGNILAYIGVS